MLSIPGMVSLGGGMPNPKLFPFSGVSFTLTDGTDLKLSDAAVGEALQYSPTPYVAPAAACFAHGSPVPLAVGCRSY
jgi:hypothetical protein